MLDQLPRLGKRELICLLSFTCNYVVYVRRSFLFLWVLGMGCVIFYVALPEPQYNYFELLPISDHRVDPGLFQFLGTLNKERWISIISYLQSMF